MGKTKIIQVVAGPGAGKTSGLVDEVVNVLPYLEQQKFLVVITYTNAAADKIKLDLNNRIKIPNNLFVGTIHSFLDRFILIPYASNLEIVPEEIVFIDEIKVSDQRYKAAATKNARDKGIITFEQIELISKKIVCGGKIKVSDKDVNILKGTAKQHSKIIGQRLQYVFVDEYQDATTTQHEIFKNLIATDVIEQFYCVGDPEQYIYGFTYRGSISKPDYKNIPINQIVTLGDVVLKNIALNRRSQPKIVKFINQFSKLQQKANKNDSDENQDVTFIESIQQDQIIGTFLNICKTRGIIDTKKFFLCYASRTIDFEDLNDVSEYVDTSLKSEKLLSESLKLICGLVGKSQKRIAEEKQFDKLELRKLAIKIIKVIKDDPEITEDGVAQILKNNFNIGRESNSLFVTKNLHSLKRIKLSLLSNNDDSKKNVKSTIHKSKGLEAEAVLVIAKKRSELTNWLETDQNVRSEDKSDTCRLGFVAFSRAKELLCIACLEDINISVKGKMAELGIKSLKPL